MSDSVRVSRRALLGGALAGAAAVGLPSGRSGAAERRAGTAGRPASKRPGPGLLPNPKAPAGTDQLPQITTIVAVMMENHTYDSLLGTLAKGDGFTTGAHGHPTNSNPWPEGSSIPPPLRHASLRSFPMPTPCQADGHPYNTWEAGHTSYAQGRMDGFVKSQSGPVSMGYYDASLMPFVNSLASVFPVCDRFFSSVMAQTYPNRRYFMAGTSLGLIADTLNFDRPPNGTIFEMLNAYDIPWKTYSAGAPSYLIWTYLAKEPNISSHAVGISEFFDDAAAGTLPAYSMVDPNFGTSSEEDPQDVQFGDQFLAQVVNAVMDSPQWSSTLLVWTYDEGGGYYDHVPPPMAVKPDDVPPMFAATDPLGGVFDRYGFRVPSGIVSPYAREDYVSDVVHDFTSILKLIETKWNLPALTFRDAAADNLLDSIDLVGTPAFLRPPVLADPIDPTLADRCLTKGPGTIPPMRYVTAG
ncbi:MAG: alkaline phosphatase family protein [Acidimicrobiales bacterium]|jgi:phospholipase C